MNNYAIFESLKFSGRISILYFTYSIRVSEVDFFVTTSIRHLTGLNSCELK